MTHSSGRGASPQAYVHLWPHDEEEEHDLSARECVCEPVVEPGENYDFIRHNRLRPGPDLWKAGLSSHGHPANYSFHLICEECGYQWDSFVVSTTGEAIPPASLPETLDVRCIKCGAGGG